jgi:hypothetical protein
VTYGDVESARAAVNNGQAWGAIYFTENYTDALVARTALWKDADNETLDQSEMRVWLDLSSKYVLLCIIPFFQFHDSSPHVTQRKQAQVEYVQLELKKKSNFGTADDLNT